MHSQRQQMLTREVNALSQNPESKVQLTEEAEAR